MSTPLIIEKLHDLRGQIWEWRGLGQTIAFVPTMGALHEGHLSLVRLARQHGKKVVVSIFVNPAQFAPGEDFDAYPRQTKHDIDLLSSEGVDLVYLPTQSSMYDAHHATSIRIEGVADGLETDHRPTFFNGVALVVTKLFNRVAPDAAIFGEKDYQQLATIRRFVKDLDMPIRIIGAPIARDEQGLALSSRNQYFNDQGLEIARQLNVIMKDCARRIRVGHNIDVATEQAVKELLHVGFSKVDYVSAADPDSLEVFTEGQANGPLRLLIAAHCKGVRLIDNCAV